MARYERYPFEAPEPLKLAPLPQQLGPSAAGWEKMVLLLSELKRDHRVALRPLFQAGAEWEPHRVREVARLAVEA